VIVTPRFTFLHLHKSGGSFVNEGLMRYEPGARQLGYHLPLSQLPDACRALPVFGLVRSPYDYYLSWFAFQSARREPNALFRVLSHEGSAGFSATTRRLLALGCDDTLLDRVIAALPARYTNHGLNLPGPALEAIRGTGLGFYSFLFRYLYGDTEGVHIARLEHLRTELPAAMERAGVPTGGPFLAWLREGPARNISAHPEAAVAYDTALAVLVGTHDAPVIRRFGYALEGAATLPPAPAPRAVPRSA
jgi:hypothetical protein